MGKFKDLTGQTFGKLTVIKRVEDQKAGRPTWLCQCECGNLTTVSSTRLMRPNGTRSCGCLKHQRSPSLIDLTGQTFGRLKVLRRDETAPGSRIKWICQCKCGNTVSVLSSSLRNGKTKSCGCSQSPVKYDLTGQEFGYLLVIGRVTNPHIRSHDVRWKCLCRNCGRIVQVDSYWLRTSDPYGHCRCTRFTSPKTLTTGPNKICDTGIVTGILHLHCIGLNC